MSRRKSLTNWTDKNSIKPTKLSKKSSHIQNNSDDGPQENQCETLQSPRYDSYKFDQNQQYQQYEESKQLFQETNDIEYSPQNYLDDEAMNQIQMEIYNSNLEDEISNKTLKIQNIISNNPIAYSQKYMKEPKPANSQKKRNLSKSNDKRKSLQQNQKECSEHLRTKHLIKKDKSSLNIPFIPETESEIQVPKKIMKKVAKREIDISMVNKKPFKKLKTEKDRKLHQINFKIDIKLLNKKENIKRVIKCLDTSKVKNRDEVKYLVELEQTNEYKLMRNVEMQYFYKDKLIDFYQGIHFS